MRTPPAGVSRIDSRLVRSRRPLPQDPCTGVAALPSAAAMPEASPPGPAGSTATESQPWPSTLGAIIGSPITSDDPAEPATPNELYVTDPAGGEEDEENVIEPEFGGAYPYQPRRRTVNDHRLERALPLAGFSTIAPPEPTGPLALTGPNGTGSARTGIVFTLA